MRLRGVLLLVFLTGCSPQNLFYYPNRHLYGDPAMWGYAYEVLDYPSLNGKKLTGILIRTELAPRGTIVHFHGNYGNVSNHFPLSLFLVKRGFDLLIFDYQGYGASQGRPSPKNTVEDGRATLRYAQAHLRDPHTGVGVLGQSLGGATAIVAVAQEPFVKAAVIEAAFASYPQMGKEALQRSAWTWLLSFTAPVLLRKKYDPIRYVADISPRPLFFIHGDKDRVVPVHMSQQLYAQAGEPKKLWIVEGANHLEIRGREGKKYEAEVVSFFTVALAKNTAAR